MKHSEHLVLVNDPHPQSLAALVLLTKKLAPKSPDYRIWLKYRKKILKERRKVTKNLKCHYCGKKNLKIHSHSKKNIATLDHVKPISKGGARFSSDNLVVACHSCNSRKKDMDVDEFVNPIV